MTIEKTLHRIPGSLRFDGVCLSRLLEWFDIPPEADRITFVCHKGPGKDRVRVSVHGKGQGIYVEIGEVRDYHLLYSELEILAKRARSEFGQVFYLSVEWE